MLGSVFTHSISERLRGVLGFSVAAVAVTAMYVGVFPSFQDQMAGYADVMPEGMSAFIGNDFASPGGYLQSTLFTILGPVIMVAAAATWAAGSIAGEEERKTLPLLLTAPLPRRRLAAQKLAAVLVTVSAVALVLFAALAAMVAVTGIDVPLRNSAAAVLHLHALGVFVAGVTFGVGAASARRTLALGVGIALVVAGFVISGVSGMIDGAQWLRWLSPFHWFNGSEPIRNGVSWGPLALLHAGGAIAAAAGMTRFDHRDLT